MAIGDPVHDRSAKARDHTDDDPDDRTAYRQPDVGEPVCHAACPSTAKNGSLRDGAILAKERHDFRHGKDAQTDDDEFQAIDQIRHIVRRHAQLAGTVAFADGADHHAEAGGHDPLECHTACKDTDHGETKDRDHQKFGRPELQHDRARDQDEHRQEGCTNEAAEKRGCEGRRKRPRGFALLGHGKPVKHRGLRRR